MQEALGDSGMFSTGSIVILNLPTFSPGIWCQIFFALNLTPIPSSINSPITTRRDSAHPFPPGVTALSTATHSCARDLDFGFPGDLVDQTNIIIAHQPNSFFKQRWISIGWPGLIGCLTGMNEEGVGAALILIMRGLNSMIC